MFKKRVRRSKPSSSRRKRQPQADLANSGQRPSDGCSSALPMVLRLIRHAKPPGSGRLHCMIGRTVSPTLTGYWTGPERRLVKRLYRKLSVSPRSRMITRRGKAFCVTHSRPTIDKEATSALRRKLLSLLRPSRYTALRRSPTPSGFFAQIVSDDFPVLHMLILPFLRSTRQ
jgi:hypothetical protein